MSDVEILPYVGRGYNCPPFDRYILPNPHDGDWATTNPQELKFLGPQTKHYKIHTKYTPCPNNTKVKTSSTSPQRPNKTSTPAKQRQAQQAASGAKPSVAAV
jgi:hypothetical protein